MSGVKLLVVVVVGLSQHSFVLERLDNKRDSYLFCQTNTTMSDLLYVNKTKLALSNVPKQDFRVTLNA